MPPITEQFNGTWQYVWLPIDEYSAENPWHIWIDIVSKFRLIEKRWSTNFENQDLLIYASAHQDFGIDGAPHMRDCGLELVKFRVFKLD